MKFTPKEDFLKGRMRYEAGNTYDADKHGLTDEDVMRFHAAGWAEVEGQDPAPERRPGPQRLEVQKAKHKASEVRHNG